MLWGKKIINIRFAIVKEDILLTEYADISHCTKEVLFISNGPRMGSAVENAEDMHLSSLIKPWKLYTNIKLVILDTKNLKEQCKSMG